MGKPPKRRVASGRFQVVFLAVMVVFGVVRAPAQEHPDIMFYTGSGFVRWDLLTHLIWMNNNQCISTNGEFIHPSTTNMAALQQLQKEARQFGKKVMFCVADYGDATVMMNNASTQAVFVQALSEFIVSNHLDGVDFDLEYPDTAPEQAKVGALLTAMRSALGRGPLLTADVSYWTVQLPVSVMNNQLDWVNIMDYYHMTNSQSQVAFARDTLQRYLNAGVAPSKLVLGVGFAGKSPSGGFDAGYNGLLSYMTPYNPNQDIVTNTSNGYIYYLSGNRTTQQAKVDLAITNANGTMVWHLLADSVNTNTSLAIAVQQQRTNRLAVWDGFEYPDSSVLDFIYTHSGTCLLSVTNERAAGDSALQATFVFNGAQWSGGNFFSPLAATGFAFPSNALLRLDLRVLEAITNGTFYLSLYDGAGLKADYYNNSVLRSNGWRRILIGPGAFQSVASGFNFNDIRRYRMLAQLAVATPASTNRVIFDNLALFNPGSSNRPVAVDLDRDRDGFGDALEGLYGTSPNLADSDGDGTDDLTEVMELHTNPGDGQRLVSAGASWAWNATGLNLGTTWRNLSYNDSAWPQGAAPLGFGLSGLGYGIADAASTVVSNGQVTTYFRKRFVMSSPADFASLLLRVRADDGAVAYLNGQEVLRVNLPGGTVGYQTLASSNVTGWNATFFVSTNLPASLLVGGTNLLAVETHLYSGTAPDLAFDAELAALSPVYGPALTLGSLGDLRWPAWSAPCSLASATNVNFSPNWQLVTNLATPILSNGFWQTQAPLNRPSDYFRLQQP